MLLESVNSNLKDMISLAERARGLVARNGLLEQTVRSLHSQIQTLEHRNDHLTESILLDQDQISELETENEQNTRKVLELEKAIGEAGKWAEKEKGYQSRVWELGKQLEQQKKRTLKEEERANKKRTEVEGWIDQVRDLRKMNKALETKNDQMVNLIPWTNVGQSTSQHIQRVT